MEPEHEEPKQERTTELREPEFDAPVAATGGFVRNFPFWAWILILVGVVLMLLFLLAHLADITPLETTP
jgi:hypothetical protein